MQTSKMNCIRVLSDNFCKIIMEITHNYCQLFLRMEKFHRKEKRFFLKTNLLFVIFK